MQQTPEVKNIEVERNSSTNRMQNVYGRLSVSDKMRGKPAYEITFLLRNDVTSQDVQSFFKKLVARIIEFNGTPEHVEYWGLRNLAYKINKSKKAHYYCLQFYGDGKLCTELDRTFKINSSVMRFVIIRLRELVLEKSPMVLNLEKDIAEGRVIYDDKYVVTPW